MDNTYAKLVKLDKDIRLFIHDKNFANAKKKFAQVIPLIEQEIEIVGKALECATFLEYAYQLGDSEYKKLKAKFLSAASKGHGWKMIRMFKIIGNKAVEWNDQELKKFCETRLNQIKEFKK